MTLRQFASGVNSIPQATSWYLADLGEARGKQELFTRQSPQRLKVLREHALIESAVSSNRIEGVEIDRARVGTVVFGRSKLRDRDEEEVRGYREALKLIHEKGAKLPVSEKTILKLHGLARGDIWDAGCYKEKDGDIIEKYPNWARSRKERWVHPLIALAAFNLDFLSIHPFRDGNGRVSRLLLLLQCYHLGYEVGRYVSIERVIEDNKDRYYETLEASSRGWHEGKHDPWLYINFLLYTLKMACREFEERVGQTKSPRGAKTELIFRAIRKAPEVFRISDIQKDCPGVSTDMVRKV
ncbi:MAG: Fic family protein, partial [Proteobacteria bacterium]|nr:Fic family protein [Pseudomonadota bacterium]